MFGNPHCQSTKNVFLLGIAQNVKNYTEKLCLPTLHSMGWVNSKIKISLLGLNEMSRSAQKRHVCQLPSLMGMGSDYKKISSLKLNEIPVLCRKMFSTPPPLIWWRWQGIFFS